ncbi:MAG: hypothetical protein AAF727_02370 [Pseudomonadota bacterium]
MKKLVAALCVLGTTAPLLAEERVLFGPEIDDLLPGIVALGVGEETVQTFSASGSTEYVASGRASVGKWWVTATQYCSSWPPASGSACYDVVLDNNVTPARLSWVGESGRPIHNIIGEKE